jgi:hypothetical protein
MAARIRFPKSTVRLALAALLFAGIAQAQTRPSASPDKRAARPAGKQAEWQFLADSLQAANRALDSSLLLLQAEAVRDDSALARARTEAAGRAQEIRELEKRIEGYRGENLKLDQSNRILIIFNSVVGLLLLVTLVWFLRNIGKKKGRKPAGDPVRANGSTGETGPAGFLLLEQKLVQLERLSKLKDQGALTEDEFQRHKQQVLGNAG